MPRPFLRQVPLEFVLPMRPGACYCTMSIDQWDAILRAAYEVGFVLLELDKHEQPVAAYQKAFENR